MKPSKKSKVGGILKNLSGLFNKSVSWKYGGVTVINNKKKHFLKTPQHNLLVLLTYWHRRMNYEKITETGGGENTRSFSKDPY